MSTAGRFDPDSLIAQSCELAGSDDFGADDGWRENLARVTDGLIHEARLSPLGIEVANADIVRALTNRLEIVAWRAAHPDIVHHKITQPIVIVGQPRTGTTILYDLLAQDPAFRVPLTWEVDMPCPPPSPHTYRDDPRIAQVQASLDMSEQIIPGFLAFHPMGAGVGQECVRIFAGQFTSMIFSVQYRLPSYYTWLLYEADHAPACAFHRVFLQHLQYHIPGQWLLKSPAHLWQLDTLLGEYPDALIVQMHRDPLNVIASIAALTNHLRRMATDDTTVAECAAQSCEEITVGLDREMRLRDDGAIPEDRVTDVLYGDFIADPWATITMIYARLGRELHPATEQRMRDHLAAHPGDGGRGRYTWADTGLRADELRDRVRPYQQRYGVPLKFSDSLRKKAFQCTARSGERPKLKNPSARSAPSSPGPSVRWAPSCPGCADPVPSVRAAPSSPGPSVRAARARGSCSGPGSPGSAVRQRPTRRRRQPDLRDPRQRSGPGGQEVP